MIPKTGNVFPHSGLSQRKRLPYAAVVADALQSGLGQSHRALKTIMLWTGVSERTAKNWCSGSVGPSGEHLIDLVRHSDSVYEAVFRRAERRQAVSIRKLVRSRTVVAEFLADLDELLDDSSRH